MTAFKPAGTLWLREALAQTAEMHEPDLWSKTGEKERSFFGEGAQADAFQVLGWTRSETAIGRAYARVRPLLADGLLPSSLIRTVGGPCPIEPNSWLGRGPDRLPDVLKGSIQFIVEDGSSAAGPVLIRASELNAALKGEKVQSSGVLPTRPHAAEPTSKAKGGNRPNPDSDRFWIEICRIAVAGDIKGGQRGLTDLMAQWATDNMDRPYDGETVRKKVGRLFEGMGWREK